MVSSLRLHMGTKCYVADAEACAAEARRKLSHSHFQCDMILRITGLTQPRVPIAYVQAHAYLLCLCCTSLTV